MHLYILCDEVSVPCSSGAHYCSTRAKGYEIILFVNLLWQASDTISCGLFIFLAHGIQTTVWMSIARIEYFDGIGGETWYLRMGGGRLELLLFYGTIDLLSSTSYDTSTDNSRLAFATSESSLGAY